MEARSIATQLLKSVESMVDPKAPVEQQLAQMREQMAALAELPNIINQKLETVNKQITQISMKESRKVVQEQQRVEVRQQNEALQSHQHYQQQYQQKYQQSPASNFAQPNHSVGNTENFPCQIGIKITKPSLTGEELDVVKREELRRSLEDLRMRKSVSPAKDHPSSQANQRDQRTARAKPTPAFGPGPQERPLYLPGGRRWRMSEYDEDQISETLVAQSEVIKGNAIGVNFKKFEKPPIGLDHLKNSEVYRAVHNIDDEPVKKVAMLRPAIAESDVRERARSMTPVNPGTDGR